MKKRESIKVLFIRGKHKENSGHQTIRAVEIDNEAKTTGSEWEIEYRPSRWFLKQHKINRACHKLMKEIETFTNTPVELFDANEAQLHNLMRQIRNG